MVSGHSRYYFLPFRSEVITLFTSQSAAAFYDKLFSSLDFTLPKAATGRRGFAKEGMACAVTVIKCEGFSQTTDSADYPDKNRLTAMKPLPSYWTYDRFLKKPDNGKRKKTMARQVKKLCGPGMHKDGKTFDNGRVRQKFCCPLRASKTGRFPWDHKNRNNGKNRRTWFSCLFSNQPAIPLYRPLRSSPFGLVLLLSL